MVLREEMGHRREDPSTGRGDSDYVGKPQEGKEGQKEQRSINGAKRKVEASRNNGVKSRDIKNTFHSPEVGDIKRQTSEC